MQMLDIDAWSRRVRGIVGLDEMHNAVRAFERNVHWAVQNEGRIRQPSRSKVSEVVLLRWHSAACCPTAQLPR